MTAPADNAARDGRSSVGVGLDDDLPAGFGFALDEVRWLGVVRAADATVGGVNLGPYRDLRPIGQGGQGLVYRAFDPRTRRVVALKRMSAGLFATPAAAARFQREIETSAALAHPNIVAVYGSDRIDDQLVLALRWVDGVPFDEWAAPRRATAAGVAEIVRAFVQVCDAVQYAHQRGVIHRDLKPSNLLVDNAGAPQVLDFGLAASLDAGADAERLTRTGALLGTPAFAPPEQLRGAAPPDVRSDVYSLGAVLYRGLAGSYPYPIDRPPHELAAEIERRGPEPPARQAPLVGRELSAILRKALRADPRERYATVDALREDLVRWERGERVLAHPPSTWYLLRKFIRRNRLVVGVGVFTVTLLAATAATTARLYLRAETQRVLAEGALLTAKRNAMVSRATVQFLTEMLRSAARGEDAGPGGLTVRAYLDRTSTQLREKAPGMDGAEVAGLHLAVAEAYRELGLDGAAVPHLEAALELRLAEQGRDGTDVAQLRDRLGRAYRHLGRIAEAEQHIEEAWRIFHARQDEGNLYLAPLANSIGLVKRSLKKYDEAEAWYREALRRYLKDFGPKSDQLALMHNNLGALFASQDRLAEAEAMYRQALAHARETFGTRLHLDTLLAQSALADVVSRRGEDSREVDGWFDEAYAGMRALFGPEHVRFGLLAERYAEHLARSARLEGAGALLREAAHAFRSCGRWPDFVRAAAREAELLAQVDCAPEADARLHATLALAAPHLGPADAVFARAYLVLGQIAASADRRADAEAALDCAAYVYDQLGDDEAEGRAEVQRAHAALRAADDARGPS